VGEEETKRRAVVSEKEILALLRWAGLSGFETKVLAFGIGNLEELGNTEVGGWVGWWVCFCFW
jgi:hypothetical protein